MGFRFLVRSSSFTSVVFALLALSLTIQPVRAQETKPAPDLQPITAEEVLQLVSKYDDGPVLLNMWATWCQPCREEMPDLLALRDEHSESGFRLILVSADFVRQQSQAAEFLGTLGVDFQTYLKNQTDNEFINQIDPEWSGALPYSALFGTDGSVIRTWEGKLTYDEVDALLRQ